jgi:hypothetical protein
MTEDDRVYVEAVPDPGEQSRRLPSVASVTKHLTKHKYFRPAVFSLSQTIDYRGLHSTDCMYYLQHYPVYDYLGIRHRFSPKYFAVIRVDAMLSQMIRV